MGSGSTQETPRGGMSEAWAARDTRWRELLARCAERDETAFEALYDESCPLVYSVALRVLDSAEDAGEVTLDVYRQVWQIAGQYREQRGSVAAWLVMQARTRAIDRKRARLSRPQLKPVADHLTAVDPAATPERNAVSGQIRVRVQKAMSSLPPEEKELLEWAFVLGMSHSEIAAKANKPLGTVKTRIRMGMIRLRNLLGDIQ